MAYNKLHRKDFVIAIKTGDDSAATTLADLKFAKEAVKGELYFNTATSGTYALKLFIATSDAGTGVATLVQLN